MFSTAISCDADASEVRKCVFSYVNTNVFSMSAFLDESPNACDTVLFQGTFSFILGRKCPQKVIPNEV